MDLDRLKPRARLRNGITNGRADPTPPEIEPMMKLRAKAESRFSTVVWSAIMALTVARYAPSKTPAEIPPMISSIGSRVRATTKKRGAPPAIPRTSIHRRPFLSERIPRGIASAAIASPSAPRTRPIVPVDTPTSGRKAVITIIR